MSKRRDDTVVEEEYLLRGLHMHRAGGKSRRGRLSWRRRFVFGLLLAAISLVVVLAYSVTSRDVGVGSSGDSVSRPAITLERGLYQLEDAQNRFLFLADLRARQSVESLHREVRSSFQTLRGELAAPGQNNVIADIERGLVSYQQSLQKAVALRESIGFGSNSGLRGEALRLRKGIAAALPRAGASGLRHSLAQLEVAEHAIVDAGSLAAHRGLATMLLTVSFDLLRLGLPEAERQKIEGKVDEYHRRAVQLGEAALQLAEQREPLRQQIFYLGQKIELLLAQHAQIADSNRTDGIDIVEGVTIAENDLLVGALVSCLLLALGIIGLGWRDVGETLDDAMEADGDDALCQTFPESTGSRVWHQQIQDGGIADEDPERFASAQDDLSHASAASRDGAMVSLPDAVAPEAAVPPPLQDDEDLPLEEEEVSYDPRRLFRVKLAPQSVYINLNPRSS